MPRDDLTYTDTARALASQIDGDDEPILPVRHSSDLAWRRRSTSQPNDHRPKWLQDAETLQIKATKLWFHFTPLQRAGIVVLNIILLVSVILGLIYNERIFAWLAPAAKRWRELPGGWMILWALTFAVSFPPMIGYSTLVTIAGFVFGMKGWLIMSTATTIGSTCGFLASRTLLKSFVGKLTEKNKRFAALSLVLKHDGLKLLIMIRLCPLPYSLSNGAISTIPTVTWQHFMLATAIASPKLLLHIFVGSRIGDLAERGDKMDAKTKAVSYITIVIGMVAGAATGYFIYVRTKARATELEAEEAAGAVGGRQSSNAGPDYVDDPNEDAAVHALRRDDDISLHPTREDEEEGYRDEFTDDEDAHERDVFDDGDGDEEEAGKKGER